MRKTLRTILKVLDGQPTGRKGQSLVEMALTTPILILMVLGLTEIGFLANNYLILMDAIRTAGRAAVNLDPTTWPEGDARNFQRLDCDADYQWYAMVPGGEGFVDVYGSRNRDTIGLELGEPPRADNLRNPPYSYHDPEPPTYKTADIDPKRAFFDEIACQVIQSMSPLLLNDAEDTTTNKDDVVVSAVSYSRLEYKLPPNSAGNTKIISSSGALVNDPTKNPWVTVTGRWPLENRVCFRQNPMTSVWEGDERDPFDYLTTKWGYTTGGLSDDNSGDVGYPPHGQRLFEIPNVLRPNVASDSQGVRGYTFSGKNRNEDGCYGSRFTVQAIEDKLNLKQYNEKVPNGGIVIVEVFWQHHPLFFGPIFQGFSNDRTKDPVLHVWSFFPLPAAEPTATPPQP